MNVLVLNAGSSSLKYQLLNMQTEEVIAKGLCERVGSSNSFHTYEAKGNEQTFTLELPNHKAAVQAVLDTLTSTSEGVIAHLDEITALGHRVVHGGDYFAESVVIDDEVIARIDDCCKLAPLHNPAGLAGIRACKELMPNKVQVAVFDTAFHQTMPAQSFMYPLPYDCYEQNKIRRYGFHGTSHRYVAERAAEYLGKEEAHLKMVTCHLGNGCSLSAVDKGKSVDTTMGFTPLEGVMMGTRCGNIDPAIILYLIDEMGMTTQEVNTLVNKQSGLLGISGSSNDLRDVCNAADEGDARAKLACDMYAHSIKKALGSYVFELGGIDAIVFTAGVGENSAFMRGLVLEGLEDLGIVLDKELNELRGGDRTISASTSAVKVLVIPTNEELMIAKDVAALSK